MVIVKFLPALLVLALFATLAPLSKADDSTAVLDEINLARTNPHLYAQFILTNADARSKADPRAMQEAIDYLNHARPLPALALSSGLSMGAMTQVLDQGATGAMGHDGGDRSTPWKRMARFGQWVGKAGENISYGVTGARQIVISLIVDSGVPNRGHRKNLFLRDFGSVGVACGAHARWGTMCVMDFAGQFIENSRYTQARRPVWTSTVLTMD
jgi:uncharacterized protein YkwD